MNVLDSRLLRLGDSFAQKFSTLETIKYVVTTAAGARLPIGKESYTIVVKERAARPGKGQQHNVIVKLRETSLVAEPPQLEIEAGDMVMWHSPDAATPGFTVVGEGQSFRFNSSAIAREAVYSHAFGTPGRYQWIDANGGPLSGVVDVKKVETAKAEDYDAWLKALGTGKLFTISGERCLPDRVEILAAQTVFWAVESAKGISITDSRLFHGKSAE
jgi:plastocyanin